MTSTRVAVTGLGAVSPVGADAPSTWAAFLAGRSGVALIEDDWAADLPVRTGARVDADLGAHLTVRETKRMDRAEQIAMVAGREAWAHAGYDGPLPDDDRDRAAVVVGTAIGGLHSTIEQQHALERSGSRKVLPHTVTMMMANGAAAWLSMAIGARGGASAPVSACASSTEALGQARMLIASGAADVVLAGGTEACVEGLTLAALAQTRALSRRQDDPSRASRPFAADRDGFVLGEGAAMLVLESEDHARARGARVLAWLDGSAVTSDAHDIVQADPDNQARTMTLALRVAGVPGSEIGFVHAHATSTPLGDLNESRAILSSVGAHPVVTSTKSMTGHLLGASGALGAVAVVEALRTGTVPPTTNVDAVDPEVEVDVATTPRTVDTGVALLNSFGFGGHNASLVFARA
ncbi:beta-ketoacyl-ACP synthase [Curtobacterium sp. MCBD17_013]|uniref:beta-ketoacyl-[acyl-carrier-protein] synthase family protein n=1 Tax=Curtobacterium sp. MCBD17_013 TaxID=2175668 RepID=UPI000DAA40B1|nr:beta-ketoacyl-[acyl-carrier-protein] synthase family protein [Curtobacterium sp. MCBD17_013]PZF63268.1 beta-ketoacyl-ACP synthase [Curtobacterium sp. MCBD17_013]